ncbi:MAG: M20/M25/M40 family metallo-hydrolase [Planctomycetota bacterium]|jgi:acetylornithine deacetylase/succinyl-diaminopimelate desuccinylase-like protein|nr:M20/M25/M40 family metallo-hydrolase [Planctomycetota bacterium]
MYSLLAAKTRGLEAEALAFTQQLIRTPSPSLHEHEVAQLVEERMRAIGYEDLHVDDYGNVVGVLRGRQGEPTLLLSAHMDTAAEGQPEAWQESPYSGAVRDGVLYGLGASDCKAGLAAQIYAGGLLRRALLPLKGNLVVAATVSEEQGGSPGLRHLMQDTLPSLDLRPDFAILGEPTGLGIYYGHDGSAVFEVLIEGPDNFQVNDATAAVFETFHSRHRAATSDGQPEFQNLLSPRFQQRPGSASGVIGVCRRLRETETVSGAMEQLKHEARAAAASVARVAVDVVVRREERQFYTKRTTVLEQRIEAWSLDPYHPLITRARHALAAAGCDVSCGKFRLPRLGMGTAGGALASQFGVPAIAYGPGSEDTCHGPNESVPVARASQAIYGTAAIAHSLVGVPVCGWTLDEI